MSHPEFAAPAPLKSAALLGALEGVVLAAYAVLEALSLTGERLAMGIGTAMFFAFVAVALGGCSWGLLRGNSWARSPLVLGQLIALGLAWSFRGGSTTWVALVLAAVAALVLIGVLHPASIRWVDQAD